MNRCWFLLSIVLLYSHFLLSEIYQTKVASSLCLVVVYPIIELVMHLLCHFGFANFRERIIQTFSILKYSCSIFGCMKSSIWFAIQISKHPP